LVIETLEQVLPGSEIYIMNDDGNTLKYFPIRPLESQQPPVTEGSESSDER
jgi:membrane protease subunit HflK